MLAFHEQNSFIILVSGVPLSVRGLDLASRRQQTLSTASKEDLQIMLSVLSEELEKVY